MPNQVHHTKHTLTTINSCFETLGRRLNQRNEEIVRVEDSIQVLC